MKDEEIQALMMKVVDGVASPEEERSLAAAIREDEKWKDELKAFRHIKEVTDQIRFKELPDTYWSGYWTGVYRRLERGLGWLLTSLGVMFLLGFAGYKGLTGLYSDPNLPLVVKIGVSLAGLGIIIMTVSVLRERLFARKHERYEKEVER